MNNDLDVKSKLFAVYGKMWLMDTEISNYAKSIRYLKMKYESVSKNIRRFFWYQKRAWMALFGKEYISNGTRVVIGRFNMLRIDICKINNKDVNV